VQPHQTCLPLKYVCKYVFAGHSTAYAPCSCHAWRGMQKPASREGQQRLQLGQHLQSVMLLLLQCLYTGLHLGMILAQHELSLHQLLLLHVHAGPAVCLCCTSLLQLCPQRLL
jgi:hypothetical protein